MRWTVTEPPAKEPVALDDAIDHLREDTGTAQLPRIQALITAAREFAENQCEHAFEPQTIKVALDGFPDASHILLPRAGLTEVVSVEYLDDAGAMQTLDPADYGADTYSKPSAIYRKTEWPATADERNAVTVTYKAGVATPPPIEQAILLLVGHWYENRVAVNTGNIVTEYPMAVEALLGQYRVMGV